MRTLRGDGTMPPALSRSPALLVQPPLCDPFATHLAVPALAAALAEAGAPVQCVDLSLELHLALATDEGLGAMRADAATEEEWLRREGAADRFRPEHVRASLGRAPLADSSFARRLAAAHEAMRRPELYRFGPDGRIRLTDHIGAWHAVAGLLSWPLPPFSASRARDVLDGGEPFPFLRWLTDAALPRLLAEEPAWVGLSITYEQQLLPSLLLGGLLRAAGIPVFAGGFHVSAVGVEGVLADPPLFDLLDGVVVGEGEIAVVDLDRAVRAGESLDAVRGLVTKAHLGSDGSGLVRLGAPVRPPPESAPRPDVATLVAPAMGLMPLDRYLAPAVVLPYQTGRGCYFGRCTFCNFAAVSPGYRRRPLDLVIADLRALAPLGTTIAFATEAEPPFACRQLEERLVEEDLGLTWEIMCRLENGLTRPILDVMARAGCRTIFFGIESAAPRVNALMCKEVSGSVGRRILGDCADLGINVVLSGIQGFPGETREEAAMTARFYAWAHEHLADRILVSGGAHQFRLTRFSPIWNDPASFGIESTGLDRVGPLAVSTPYRTTRSGEAMDVPASAGRIRDALVPEDQPEVDQPSPAFTRSPNTGARGPVRQMRPLGHDLLRLMLEACNPGGFRHEVHRALTAPPPAPQGRPQRFGAVAEASIRPLELDPDTAFPSRDLHCLNPAFAPAGVLVPKWFGGVLELCAPSEGADLASLQARTEELRPQPGPPAVAWLGRLLPQLWSSGILRDVAIEEPTAR